FEQWMESRSAPRSKTFHFISRIPEVYWDYSGAIGPVSFRGMPRLFGTYASSRATWTPEQRRHARAVLLFMTYSSEGDANLPHHSMLAGHPNFVMDVKQVLPLACATFPNHPDAKKWRASFMGYFREWLAAYQREADARHNAAGGRWTENIACYSGAALLPLLHSHVALQRYDQTDLLAHPRMHAWVRWYRDAMMSPHEGQRYVPPEGAHADSFDPNNARGFWPVLFDVARRMKNSAPALSEEMRWIETNGREGKKPAVASMLIKDHGPFLRHDFGGPDEAYLHLMQISGRWNYRWGDGSDVLYYGAKNKIWSYNGREDAGDEFNLNNVSSFSVGGKGLGRRDTDQPLYDFGFAQFYRAMANPNAGGKAGYKSRGMMMVRGDYVVLSDEVEGEPEGQLVWANAWEMPQIYQLKPGVEFATDKHQ
ncbi:MAG: hypothetical protein M3463_05205, partial [Verrucomicrobiota bacterium]|nr:hypothetical protein [Verrucomicrobiota bacterium]